MVSAKLVSEFLVVRAIVIVTLKALANLESLSARFILSYSCGNCSFLRAVLFGG